MNYILKQYSSLLLNREYTSLILSFILLLINYYNFDKSKVFNAIYKDYL